MLQGQNVLHSFIFGVYGGLSSSSTVFLHGLTPFVSWDCVFDIDLFLDIEIHILSRQPWWFAENLCSAN
jgi:hypothetical protein